MKNHPPRATHHTRSRRTWCVPLVFLLTLTALGCRRAPTPSLVPAALPPPPDDLVAVAVIAHPEATFRALRALAGPRGALLPTSLAMWAGSFLQLAPAAIEQLDTDLPIVGALLAAPEARGVLALHVRDGARLLELMTAPGAAYAKGATAADGLVELRQPQAGTSLKLGIVNNYLVAAPDLEAVRSAVPFITRDLAARPAPADDLVITSPRAALTGKVTPALKRWWEAWKRQREDQDTALRRAHGGSAPDFGDPAEALADIDARAGHFWELLADLHEASLRVNLASLADSPNLHLELGARGETAGGAFAQEVSTLAVGDGQELLRLPADVAGALLVYDNRAARDDGAAKRMDAIAKILGGRLESSDRSNIEASLHGWAEGRGDWLSVGVLADNGKRAGVWRGAVANASAMQHAMVSLLRLSTVPAIAAPVATWIGELKVPELSDVMPALGTIQSVRILRRPAKLRRSPREAPVGGAFDVAWSVGANTFAGAVGEDARTALDKLQRAGSGKTLGDLPALRAAITAARGERSLVAFVDLERLGVIRSHPATIVLSYGKPNPTSAAESALALDLPPALLVDYAGEFAAALFQP
jgi:hypothetical protein